MPARRGAGPRSEATSAGWIAASCRDWPDRNSAGFSEARAKVRHDDAGVAHWGSARLRRLRALGRSEGVRPIHRSVRVWTGPADVPERIDLRSDAEPLRDQPRRRPTRRVL